MDIINGLTDFNADNVVDLAALRAVNLAPSAPAQPTTVEEWAEYIRAAISKLGRLSILALAAS